MTKAILAGGPEHGRRVASSGTKRIENVVLAPPRPAAEIPPRPPWWRPARLRRWKRRLAPIPEPWPDYTVCSYRRDGQLDDGTPVYWLEVASPDPSVVGDDLEGYLARAYHAVLPRDRVRSRWVMNPQWHDRCRASPGPSPGNGGLLLGLPVEVRDDGGVPHLETGAR